MNAIVEHRPQAPSLVAKIAARYSVDPQKLMTTLKATAFQVKNGPEVTNEQMMALLIVADQYSLNPFTKEIYAFPDKGNGIVPVVGIDGFSRIINSHPQFDGMEFSDSPETDKAGLPLWIECRIHRKDRLHPTVVREYMAECRRGTGPWQSHPRRMLRHRSLAQGARLAFGFVGIFDPDEAERMQETVVPESAKTVEDINARLAARSQQPADLMPMRDEVTDVAFSESSTQDGSKPDQEQEGTAASDESARAAGEVAQPEGDAPARLTYAQIMDALKSATTIDGIDQVAADHLEGYSNVAQRKELVAEYKRLRAAIEAKQ